MGLERKEKKKLRKKREHNILLILVATVLLFGVVFVLMLPNDEKWVQKGNKISKKDETYNIGDYYQYDATNDNQIKGLTDVKWKVMGVDEKGNLLIVSASSVETLTLGKKDDVEKTKKDYEEATSKLNQISEKYGSGKNALGARSITINDINKITMYDTKYSVTYGKNVTYFWGKNGILQSQVENNEINDIKIQHNDEFYWYNKDENKWMTNKKDNEVTYEEPQKITTLKNELIMYSNNFYDDENEFEKALLDIDSPEYKMIFKEDEGTKANYWLSNQVINATDKYLGHGYNVVRGDEVNYSNLIYFNGVTYEITAGVRVVVTID